MGNLVDHTPFFDELEAAKEAPTDPAPAPDDADAIESMLEKLDSVVRNQTIVIEQMRSLGLELGRQGDRLRAIELALVSK